MLKFSQNTNESKRLSALYRQGRLLRIAKGVYSDELDLAPEVIVTQNWMQIVSYLVPGGILSYRTAHELKPLAYQDKLAVFVTGAQTKTIELPGLVIKVYKGNTQDYIEQVLPELARSNTARMLLENLSTVRGADYVGVKTVAVEGVETILTKALRLRGEPYLNALRDEAKIIAKDLKLTYEYDKLYKIISALLATYSDHTILNTPYARAAAQQRPYDDYRVKIFDSLVIYLRQCELISRPYEYSKAGFKNLSFYESYFSNFIEGTEFLIDEAEDIVFKGHEIANRHADSHDVLANFLISSDYSEMSLTPQTPEQLIELLQSRHAILMKERPEKHPGEFKQKQNKAGNTLFVSAEETLGTLYEGFLRYETLNPGLEKAIFMQFLISEVHPFDDGNGRLSRIMMNAELVHSELYKIIMPSVYRDSYLNGLRLASRDGNFRTLSKVIDQMQAYTASINWSDYGETREKLENDCAHLSPDEGVPSFNRVIRELKLSYISA